MQADRETGTLIAILRTPTRGQVKIQALVYRNNY